MEGDGKATLYAGGWSDYLAQKGAGAAPSDTPKPKAVVARPVAPKPAKGAANGSGGGLSFTEKHRLDALPGEIDRLTAEIAKLETFLADPALFTREPVKFKKASEGLVERQQSLAAAEEEWLDLMERDEG
jgi:ATP-binding cassette subfamily F protein uup